VSRGLQLASPCYFSPYPSSGNDQATQAKLGNNDEGYRKRTTQLLPMELEVADPLVVR
ncbi:unnamed protein product, partial [Brassica oleracea]